ncbi:hypothetical protein [Stappia indica]|uniref:hypothetical protein n=1 Tax=Stappia indica TaxID=538381 RepID=UPI001D1883E7|nr:hypothetical protein [Stappia indica]MCC4242965.1 hypothetical protein [Stappia indica]
MPIVCNVPFFVFKQDIIKKMAGENCPIKMAIGVQVDEELGVNSDDLVEWAKEALADQETSDRPAVNWTRDSYASFIADLKSHGSGSKKQAAALYYRLHYHLADLSYADNVDRLVFGKPYRELFPTPVFEDIGHAPNLRLPVSGSTLHYASTATQVLGRDTQVEQLARFLGDRKEKNFRWLQLAGVGGQGKSRLAYELVKAHIHDWYAGFLSAGDLQAFSEHWDEWQVGKPTLIVIDYVLGQEDEVGKALRSLANPARTFAQPVRLLLIERQRWDRGGLEKPATAQATDDASITKFQLSSGGHAEWFLKLCGDGNGFNGDIAACRSKVGNGVVELTTLTPDQLADITADVMRRRGVDRTFGDHWRNEVKATLARIDTSGRPLFAYFLAVALSDGASGVEPRDGEPEWTRERLLSHVLDRERIRRWTAIFGRDATLPGSDTPEMHLALLATMIGGYDNAAMRRRLPQQWLARFDRATLERANVIVETPRGTGAPLAGIVWPLQPDILGEWFVLSSLTGGFIETEALCEAAWKCSSALFAAFLQRCTQDFPLRAETHELLNAPLPDDAARAAYRAVSAVMMARLIEGKCETFPLQLMEQLEAAAIDDEDAAAQVVLGYCKSVGIGFEKNEEAGFALTKAAAQSGHAAAMFILGAYYEEGIGIEVDLEEAARLYRKAAEAGYTAAMFLLGVCHENGTGVAVDPEEAVRWYRKAAEAGDAAAMHNLGICHENGTGVAVDPEEAVRWYRTAAEAGNVAAMFQLGVCQQEGTGVEADPDAAVHWYQKAAATEYADAMFNLGFCFMRAVGVEVAFEEAVRWYRKAAEAGHPAAMYNLGVCHENGIGVEPASQEAVRWYRLAAESGEADAMFKLGACQQKGTGVEADPEEAVRWYRKAAEAGHADAMFNLSICYHEGIGSETDPQEAVRWLRQAAEADHADAMCGLGICYHEGRGVEADPQEAVRWYRKAAEADHAAAMCNLGICYHEGTGVAVDPEEAVRWYRKAAKAGHAPAMFNLSIWYHQGMGIEADHEEAVRWYRKAAEAGVADAMFNLGVCYQRGMGVALDPEEAVRWYRKAAEAGDADAMVTLGACYQQGMGIEADSEEAERWYLKAKEAGGAGLRV